MHATRSGATGWQWERCSIYPSIALQHLVRRQSFSAVAIESAVPCRLKEKCVRLMAPLLRLGRNQVAHNVSRGHQAGAPEQARAPWHTPKPGAPRVRRGSPLLNTKNSHGPFFGSAGHYTRGQTLELPEGEQHL